MAKDKIILGSKVRDTVTGLTGIAVTRTEHLHKCDRCLVQPPCKDDGSIPPAYMIDGISLEVLAAPTPELLKTLPQESAPPQSKGCVTEQVTNN